jgi:hypothetical protein
MLFIQHSSPFILEQQFIIVLNWSKFCSMLMAHHSWLGMLILGSRLNYLNWFDLGALGMVSLGEGQMKALFSRKLLVSIYQCWNYSMNKNCFACITPSNPKFDKRLWNKSFSQHKIEKSDSTVLVPGKSIATTPQYSIRFGNRAPSKD